MNTGLKIGIAALLAATLATSAAPFAASNDKGTAFRAEFEREMAADGLTWKDLPTVADIHVFDLSTGTWSVQHEALQDYIDDVSAMYGDPVAPRPSSLPTGESLAAGGQIRVACSDSVGICLNVTSRLVTDPTVQGAVNASRADVASLDPGLSPFYFASGDNWRVSGNFHSGSFRVPDATKMQGLGVADDPNTLGKAVSMKGLAGTGVGYVSLFAFSWGSNLFISAGKIQAHGEFVFCNSQKDTACAT